jgi:hypothetical protein
MSSCAENNKCIFNNIRDFLLCDVQIYTILKKQQQVEYLEAIAT